MSNFPKGEPPGIEKYCEIKGFPLTPELHLAFAAFMPAGAELLGICQDRVSYRLAGLKYDARLAVTSIILRADQ